MKWYKIVVIALVFLMLMSVIGSGFVHAEDVDNEGNNYIVRDPIRIDGNSDFAAQAAAEGWPGDGSEWDPYVIEGYEIDGTGHGYGIYVGNTTVHFVVRGCYVHNASGHLYGRHYHRDAGIYINNVQKGILEDNIASSNGHGILLWNSSRTMVDNNTLIYNAHISIYLGLSTSNVIIQNNISHNVAEGISLSGSNNNTIIKNTLSNNVFGISLAHSVENTIIHNKIYHEKGSSGPGISLQHSDNNFINNNTISNYRIGIWGDTSFDNVVEDNTFTDIAEHNIYFFEEVNGRIPDSENHFKYLALIFVASISIAVAIIVISLIIRKHKDKQK